VCVVFVCVCLWLFVVCSACLAQLVERKTLNLVVVGSSPTVGTAFVYDFVSFVSFAAFAAFVSFAAFAAGR
jgi:hypothetical protein